MRLKIRQKMNSKDDTSKAGVEIKVKIVKTKMIKYSKTQLRMVKKEEPNRWIQSKKMSRM